LRLQVEIVFGKKNATAVFGDKWVRVSHFAARFVQLEARPAGEPDEWYAGVVQRSREFVKAGYSASAGGD
jgi:hypothetical protein